MKDIKDYRASELKNYVIGNIMVICVITGAFDFVFDGLSTYASYSKSDILLDFASSIMTELIGVGIISSIIYIYVFIIDSILPGNLKFFICYFGKHQPGYTIFEDMKKEVKDDRFTRDQVIKKYQGIYDLLEDIGSHELRRKKQNAEWYKIYQKHRDEGMISVANRDYLLARDLCVISLIILGIYIALCALTPLTHNCEVLAFIVIEFLVTNLAMRSKGRRLAYNVIAADVSMDS